MKKVIVIILFIILGYMLNKFIKNLFTLSPGITSNVYKTSSPAQQIIGGDKDEHGCLGSAGYTWCEKKSKCLRVWEEQCD